MMAGHTVGTIVGGVQVVNHPGFRRIARSTHRDIGASRRLSKVDKENDREPSVGCFVVVAAGVAGKLFQSLAKKDVHVERAGDHRAIGAVEGVGRVDRLKYETIAYAQALVGWLKFQAEVGHGTVTAADTVEVPE